MRRTLLWVLVTVGIAAALLAAAVALHRRGILRFNYPSQARFPVRGVDVSHHQGPIDWEPVRAAGIEFAFIKATEGSDHLDSRFEENWEAAGRAGVARGAYHFFTFCTPGIAQAEHFLSRIAPLPAELPPAADVEFSGNCRGWSSIEDIRSELRQFFEHVERALGRTPALYLTRESHERIAGTGFERHPLWVRDIFFEPSTGRYGAWAFWQFADNGRLPGVQGPIDLNVFCCSRRALRGLRPAPGS